MSFGGSRRIERASDYVVELRRDGDARGVADNGTGDHEAGAEVPRDGVTRSLELGRGSNRTGIERAGSDLAIEASGRPMQTQTRRR